MVLTGSMEINGFVNTRREKMERNVGWEYTKYRKRRRRFPQPPLADETSTVESVRADGFSEHCTDDSENLAIK